MTVNGGTRSDHAVAPGRDGDHRGAPAPAVTGSGGGGRVAGIAAVGTGLVLLAARSGPGVTNDSVAYLATARNLAGGGELTNFDGGRLRIFPPGFPTAVAALVRGGLSVTTAALVLGAVTAVLVVVGTWRLCRELGVPEPLALLAAAVVAVNRGMVQVHAMAWSETIFDAATLAALVVLTRVHRDRRVDRAALVRLAAAVGVACATRYAGVVLLALAGGVVLLAALRDRRPRPVARAAGTAALCSWGAAWAVLPNVLAGRPASGTRSEDGAFTLREVVGHLFDTYGGYLRPGAAVGTRGVLGVVLVAAFVAAGAVVAGRSWRARAAVGPGRRRAGDPLLPLAAFLLAYVSFLVYSETVTMLNPLDRRLLAPSFGPMVALGAGLVARLAGVWDLTDPTAAERPVPDGRPAGTALPSRAGRAVVAVGVALVAFTSWQTLTWAVDEAPDELSPNAVGAADAGWIGMVRSLPDRSVLVSDDPYRLHWATGHQPVLPEPGLRYYARVPAGDRAAEVHRAVVDHGRGFLVTFGRPREQMVEELGRAGVVPTFHARRDGVFVHRLLALP